METAAQDRTQRKKTALAQAVAHPLRTSCLTIFAEQEASATEIGRALGKEVSLISYHVTALLNANLIEEVRTRPVRGTVEHFYKAIDLPCIETGDGLADLEPDEQRGFAEAAVSLYAADAAGALAAGTLLSRPDHHLTRLVLKVDQEGWEKLTAAFMKLYDEAFEVQAEAVERMAQTGEEPIRVLSFQSLFEQAPRQLGDALPRRH